MLCEPKGHTPVTMIHLPLGFSTKPSSSGLRTFGSLAKRAHMQAKVERVVTYIQHLERVVERSAPIYEYLARQSDVVARQGADAAFRGEVCMRHVAEYEREGSAYQRGGVSLMNEHMSVTS
jgi:hypothetical protein